MDNSLSSSHGESYNPPAFPPATGVPNPAEEQTVHPVTSSSPQPEQAADSKDFSLLVGMTLAEIERHAILETLDACGGNKAQAARMLGVSEKTIYNKLKQYRSRKK